MCDAEGVGSVEFGRREGRTGFAGNVSVRYRVGNAGLLE